MKGRKPLPIPALHPLRAATSPEFGRFTFFAGSILRLASTLERAIRGSATASQPSNEWSPADSAVHFSIHPFFHSAAARAGRHGRRRTRGWQGMDAHIPPPRSLGEFVSNSPHFPSAGHSYQEQFGESLKIAVCDMQQRSTWWMK